MVFDTIAAAAAIDDSMITDSFCVSINDCFQVCMYVLVEAGYRLTTCGWEMQSKPTDLVTQLIIYDVCMYFAIIHFK